jgi:hypothetical protein
VGTRNLLGDELPPYPDALLAAARDGRVAELLKLEKQWLRFLADDRAPSCSLKAMDRPLRKFVHEYSDFWCLRTESYDPEGRRYIHCNKLPETRAPHPLLSDAARRWRGPSTTAFAPSLPTGPAVKATSPYDDRWLPTEPRVPLKVSNLRNYQACGMRVLIFVVSSRPAPPPSRPTVFLPRRPAQARA